MGTQVVYSQENSTGNYNSILPTIYIKSHSLCYDFSTPTLMSIPCPHIHYSSALCPITHLPCIYLKANMLYTCALMSYPLISVIHACTMCTP